MPFLGFVFDAQGIRAAPDRLEVIENSSIPINKQHLQAFLGVCGYYRRFVVRHANYIDPFRNLLQTGNQWNWTNEHTRAFKDLKDNFTRAVTLNHYVQGVRFRLQTDASDIGISGVLY